MFHLVGSSPLLSSLGPNTIEVPTLSTTTSSISLTWRKPPGEVFKYKVEWNNGGSQMVKYTYNTSADLSSLIPGTIYTITVTAVAGDNQTKGDGRTLTSVTSNKTLHLNGRLYHLYVLNNILLSALIISPHPTFILHSQSLKLSGISL